MTDAVRPLQIIAYSDYVCPWCYIGLQRIEELQREFPVEVEWRPFELHPETPTTGADLRGRLGSSGRARAYRDNILMLAHESGLEMRMPMVVANSHLSLEAAEFARDHGGFEAYHRALFHAYFEEGRDIGDVEVLCEIARACGVDDQGSAAGARRSGLRAAHRRHNTRWRERTRSSARRRSSLKAAFA